MKVSIFLFLTLQLYTQNVFSQDSLKTIGRFYSDTKISCASLDSEGNIFFGTINGDVVKISKTGKEIVRYSTNQNFEINKIEANRRQKILVFYKSIQKMTILDRQLCLNNEIDFGENIGFVEDITLGNDNDFWVIESNSQSLVRYNYFFNRIDQKAPLNQIFSKEIPDNPKLDFINNKLFITLNSYGVYVLDYQGTYLFDIAMPSISSTNGYGDELIVRTEKYLLRIDQKGNPFKALAIDNRENLVEILKKEDKLYFIREDKIEIMRLN